MRSYGQYCSVAKALDVVGDRWTLLIVRELMLRGSARYTDIREGLPGIATNLLADRLRELEREGLLARRPAPPPVAAMLFELTDRGRELEPVLDALGRWGVPFMAEGPCEGDEFRSRWLTWPAEAFLADHEPGAPPATVELNAGGEPVVLEISAGKVQAVPGPVDDPDVSLSASPHTLLGVLSGQIDLATARSRDLELHGDERVIRRMQPLAA
ncbi:MAG TPA: winged helix-turn-helix transcriptional regulator [Solirubrobacteraceae bacterium]|nr:winged helix-turn-helix transcriptional regulator [Solirubrobacteraceae bacterium]